MKNNTVKISVKDKSILRELAERQVEIAADSVNKEKISEWKRLNSLKKDRPLVWINEIPWHEMDVDAELELKTKDLFLQIDVSKK